MNRYCITCKWFEDGRFSKTYITPRCKQRGDDDAMWMRSHLCGLDGTLYEPNEPHLDAQPVEVHSAHAD